MRYWPQLRRKSRESRFQIFAPTSPKPRAPATLEKPMIQLLSANHLNRLRNSKCEISALVMCFLNFEPATMLRTSTKLSNVPSRQAIGNRYILQFDSKSECARAVDVRTVFSMARCATRVKISKSITSSKSQTVVPTRSKTCSFSAASTIKSDTPTILIRDPPIGRGFELLTQNILLDPNGMHDFNFLSERSLPSEVRNLRGSLPS